MTIMPIVAFLRGWLGGLIGVDVRSVFFLRKSPVPRAEWKHRVPLAGARLFTGVMYKRRPLCAG